MKKEPILAWLGAWAMRLLGLTLRIETRDHAGFFDPERKHAVIGVLWHNRIFITPIYYRRFGRRRKRPLVVLTSASRDGTLLAELVRRFGMLAVRGSSSRRGASAVRELAAVLEQGADIAITPDGPRGPRYVANPGFLFIAQKTGLPLMLTDVEYSSYWELKSWDGFRIPKPFSRVVVTHRLLEQVATELDEAAFEAERKRFEAQLMEGV